MPLLSEKYSFVWEKLPFFSEKCLFVQLKSPFLFLKKGFLREEKNVSFLCWKVPFLLLKNSSFLWKVWEKRPFTGEKKSFFAEKCTFLKLKMPFFSEKRLSFLLFLSFQLFIPLLCFCAKGPETGCLSPQKRGRGLKQNRRYFSKIAKLSTLGP